MSRRFREAELSEPVRKFLEGLGFAVYAEVPCFDSAIDIVAIRGSQVLAIELKMVLSWQVLKQAALDQLASDEAYAAVATRPRAASLGRAQQLGVGVLRVGGGVELLVAAMPQKYTYTPHRERILAYCHLIEPGGIGGKPCEKGMGPAIDVEVRVADYRRVHPGATWRECFEAVPNHYASARSMQSAFRSNAERRAFRSRKARREWPE